MNAHVWRALAWSVAAAIGARVDVQVRLADPAVDGYDGLFISRPGVTVTDDHVELVELGIAVFRDQLGPANEVPPTIWSDLAAGRTSVAAIATPHAQRLASKASTPAPAHTTAAHRGVAAVLTQSALFGLDVDASPAARYVNHRPTLTNPGRHEYRAAFASAITDIDAAPGPGCLEPLKYWLLTVDIDGAPYDLALIDTDGYVHFPDRSRSKRLDLTKLDADLAGWEVLHLPADGGSLADRLAPLIRRHAQPESSVPAFGLPMVLSAFNRKERFFVFRHASGSDDSEALHAPSIGLSPRMRSQLSAAVGSEIPSGAFVATDYHLNWLYAALQWHAGTTTPGTTEPYPRRTTAADEAGVISPAHIDGTQEDIDLLVAWVDKNGSHVLAVEAKAYGAWGNTQWRSKLARLAAIKSAAADIDLRFVLASPNEPRKLATQGLPAWAKSTQSPPTPNWTRLPAPGLRVKTTRCTEDGTPSADGDRWRITPPSSH